jgi:hypothetical protein
MGTMFFETLFSCFVFLKRRHRVVDKNRTLAKIVLSVFSAVNKNRRLQI